MSVVRNIRAKQSSAWQTIEEVRVKVSGVHKVINRVYTKYNGSWYIVYERGVPLDVRLLTDLTSAPTGYTKITDYDGYYLMIDSTGAHSTDGAATHNAASHSGAAYSSDSGTYSHPKVSLWKLFPNAYLITPSSHYHIIAHTHSGNSTNNPLTYALSMVKPNDNKQLIPSGTTILWSGSTVPTGFSLVNENNRYIRVEASGLGETADTGYHEDSWSGYSYTHSAAIDKKTYSGSTQYYKHKHTINHTHRTYNTPSAVSMQLLKVDSDITFTDLPSGTILLYYGSVAPAGWSMLTGYDNRLLRIVTASGISLSGSTTHQTTAFAGSSGGWTKVASISSKLESTKNRYFEYNHTHTINHRHIVEVDWMPLHKKIALIKKD